jgi:hypothetical protein
MSREKQIEKEIEEMAHSLRIRKLDNEKIGFDVLSRLTGNAYEDEETSIARHIITQLGYRKQSEGEWVHSEYDDNAACSVCGEEPFDFKEPLRDPRCAQYCPYCGARMRGVNYGTLETWEEIEAENERERNECR